MKHLRYTVKVIALIAETRVVGKEWDTLSTDKDGKAVRGYTPEIEKTVQADMCIFEQTVETLNIGALVLVVNNLYQPIAVPGSVLRDAE